MSIALQSATKSVKSTSRIPEVMSPDEVISLIQEQLSLALEALERKAQRKNGAKTMRSSLQPVGRIFGVTGETMEGEIRTMACRFGARVGLKNRPRKKRKNNRTFVVYEMINSSLNLKRTLLKLNEDIQDLERRLSLKPSRKKKAQLQKTLASKRAQLANPILKPTYRSINIEGVQSLRIAGRIIQVEGRSK